MQPPPGAFTGPDEGYTAEEIRDATRGFFGTTPMAYAIPGNDQPMVLDMATTVAAMGKIKMLAQQGAAMPEGWMVGRDGAPLTDPARRSEGFMLPIGGPKGFGLSVAIGLLAGSATPGAKSASVLWFILYVATYLKI